VPGRAGSRAAKRGPLACVREGWHLAARCRFAWPATAALPHACWSLWSCIAKGLGRLLRMPRCAQQPCSLCAELSDINKSAGHRALAGQSVSRRALTPCLGRQATGPDKEGCSLGSQQVHVYQPGSLQAVQIEGFSAASPEFRGASGGRWRRRREERCHPSCSCFVGLHQDAELLVNRFTRGSGASCCEQPDGLAFAGVPRSCPSACRHRCRECIQPRAVPLKRLLDQDPAMPPLACHGGSVLPPASTCATDR